jgi:hypothetical protein
MQRVNIVFNGNESKIEIVYTTFHRKEQAFLGEGICG